MKNFKFHKDGYDYVATTDIGEYTITNQFGVWVVYLDNESMGGFTYLKDAKEYANSNYNSRSRMLEESKAKEKLFKECLIAECDSDKSRDYENGLSKAISIMGLAVEYFRWSYGKTAVKKYVPFVGETWEIVTDKH